MSPQPVSSKTLLQRYEEGGRVLDLLWGAQAEIERLNGLLKGRTLITDDERDREIERLRSVMMDVITMSTDQLARTLCFDALHGFDARNESAPPAGTKAERK
jgi:hypothetical protein